MSLSRGVHRWAPLLALLQAAPALADSGPESDKVHEALHVSISGGYGYNYFYSTQLHSGFAELRVGGQVGGIELTARGRVRVGITEGGRLFLSDTISFGLLGRLHSHVWLGFEISSLPPLSWLFVRRSSGQDFVRDMLFEVAPELRIDLVRGSEQVVFLTARAGLLVGLASHPAFLSPNFLVGIGYAYENPTTRPRAPRSGDQASDRSSSSP